MCQAVRQFHQRERVTTSLGDDPVAHPFVEWSRDRRPQQGPRVLIRQTVDGHLREPRQLLARLTLREHDGHRLGSQPPRHEGECLRRGAVEPLRVVDDAEQRLLLGHLGQEGQRREPDEESIGRFTRAQPEGRGKRVALRVRQMRETIQHRRAELMQAGERKLHLGLDARRPRDPTFRRARGEVLQQRGLADTRLAAKDEDSAMAREDVVNRLIEGLALAPPTPQP